MPPPLRLVRVAEIPVPGPLPGGRLWVEDGGVRVPLREGEAVVSLEPGSPARLVEDGVALEVPAGGDWVLGPGGRYRFRTRSDGEVEAEKRCGGCRRGWRRAWRLRLGAATPSPPLVFGPRVCYAALDNQVYCVRASNGHRAWATDLGDRVSRPLALWTGPVRPGGSESGRLLQPQVLQVILVVPDGGEALVALDAYDGRRLAAYEVPAPRGRLVSPAAVAPGGRVVVARQGYRESEAAIEVLEIAPVEEKPAGSPPPGTYNDAPRETPGPGTELPVP